MFSFTTLVVFGAVCLVVGFVGGALFFRRHGARVEADVAKASVVAQAVKETTKAL